MKIKLSVLFVFMSFSCSLSLAVADDLDLIPDSLLSESDVSELSPEVDEKSPFGKWDAVVRGQVQGNSSDDEEPRVYLSGKLYGEKTLGMGRAIANLNIRTLYEIDESYTLNDNSTLDVKELYYSYNVSNDSFIDIGRINHKAGVAYGFNPTDYFKEDVTVDTTDSDARSRRDNRLGTLGFRFEKAFDTSSFVFLISPELAPEPDELMSDKRATGLNFQRSNPKSRILLSLSNSSSTGWFNRFSYLHFDDQDRIGLSTSHVLSDKVLGYAEISGMRGRTLFSQYLQDGIESGSLGESFVSQFTEETSETRFQSNLGLSYTSENDIVTTFEYIHSDLGPSDKERKKWYSLLQDSPEQTAALWGIRGFYLSQEQPFARDSLWLRSVWSEPIENCDLGFLSTYILDDSSYLLQGSVKYDVSDTIDLELKSTWFNGSDRSYYGSLSNEYQYLLQLSWYL